LVLPPLGSGPPPRGGEAFLYKTEEHDKDIVTYEHKVIVTEF